MSLKISEQELSLGDYADHIKLKEKYLPINHKVSSDLEKLEIVNSLLHTLIMEERLCDADQIPDDYTGKRNLLRALLNIRPPFRLKKNFLEKIDRLLQHELCGKTVIECDDIPSAADKYNADKLTQAETLFLWKGDITCLKADAIVNAANDGMLGCFQPLHNCIDNVIHSAAGPQLREDCRIFMDIQGKREQTGDSKITRAYNLPSKYVLHTVGPIITGHTVLDFQEDQLASCYCNCLDLASQVEDIRSIAFPCISTGVFNFPGALAAEVAVEAVSKWLRNNTHHFKHIIFNVFLEEDFTNYARVFRGSGN